MSWNGRWKSLSQACSRKKSMAASADTTTNLRRCLTTIDLTFIGIGSTLGSGIYVLTGEVARNKTGPAVVVSFSIAALVSLFSGLCYAEFGARVPKAGSAYAYCYLTIGEFVAFVIGWNLLLEYVIAIAAIARGSSSSIDALTGKRISNGTAHFIGDVDIPGFARELDFFAAGLVVIFTILNSIGMKHSSRIINLLVVLNLLTIAVVIIAGSKYAIKENWSTFAPFGMSGVVRGASTCFFAYVGFDVITTTSEETKNPGKSIPISIMLTICVCFVSYFAVSAVITLMVPYTELDVNAAVANAFLKRHVGAVAYIVGVGSCICLLGCTMVTMIPVPRVLYAMAQDGMIFSFFSRVHRRTNVPVIATVVSGLFTAFITVVLDLSELVEMLSIGTLLAYSIVIICVLVLRFRVDLPTLGQGPATPPANASAKVGADPAPGAASRRRYLDVRRGRYASHAGLIVNLCILAIVVELLVICGVLVFAQALVNGDHPEVLIPLVLLVVLLIATVSFLSLQRQSCEPLVFKVPFLPWLPVAALFMNVYLMFELSVLTWVRTGVWMVAGLILYFTYSIRHSVVKVNQDDDGKIHGNGRYAVATATVDLYSSQSSYDENSPLLAGKEI